MTAAELDAIRKRHETDDKNAFGDAVQCHRDRAALLQMLPVDRDAVILALVAQQAEDDGLWFRAETAAEAYVQQALRKLHEAIEGKSQTECAIEAIKKSSIPT